MPQPSPSKVIFITAGGAGMYCGSCMRDNTLVRNLLRQGWNIELIPAYTPIRTDEENVSVDRVFLGGINLYLRQAVPLLRRAPPWLLSWLDRPSLIRGVTAGQIPVDPARLGPLTLSILTGESGALRMEHLKFVSWLREEARPSLVNLTNLLIGGCIPLIRRELPGVPILVTLQGDDLFLNQLVEPWKSRVIGQMRALARQVDRFVTFSGFYADLMSDLLQVPRSRFDLVPLGIELSETVAPASRSRSGPPVVGFFARISREKGFHHAVDAFLALAGYPGMETVRFHAGGWLGAQNRGFYETQLGKLAGAGLRERFHYVGSPDAAGKREFFRQIDVFSVPAEFLEPKGIYVLEALAAGLPVVQPAHGCFPDLLRDCPLATLVKPRDAGALARAWHGVLSNLDGIDPQGGVEFVRARATAEQMARATGEIYRRELSENRLPAA